MYIAMTGKGKGELDTLKVPELDKYIEHNKLSKNGKKIDQIKRITVHYYETSKESTFPSSVSVGKDSDESDSDNDLVLYDESESESESDNDSRYCNNTRRHINRKWPQSRILAHKMC